MGDFLCVKFFIWVSWLGSAYAILGLTLVVAIILAYRKRWSLVFGLFTSIFGSAVTAYILKEMIARPRPEVAMQAYTASTLYSFPSIHATLAVAFYVFIMWLIYGTLSATRKYLTIAAISIIILAIGFSRLYLGVHYPSDVAAGAVIGFILGKIFSKIDYEKTFIKIFRQKKF